MINVCFTSERQTRNKGGEIKESKKQRKPRPHFVSDGSVAWQMGDRV